MMTDPRRFTSADTRFVSATSTIRALFVTCVGWWACSLTPVTLHADDAASESLRQLTMELVPVLLRAPETYQQPISLKAVRRLEITAQVDGTVDTIQAELGGSAVAQSEAIRLESTELELELERAQARLREVEALQKSADAGGDPLAMEAAAAAVDVAEAELNLARYRMEQAIVRFPFSGQIAAIHVAVGQYVRVGEPLITFVDTTSLMVEVPIVRDSVQQGDSLQLAVEQTQATGTVDIVLPLPERFGPLRDLVPSIALAVVTINNSTGSLDAGQTVFSPLIPRHPVTEVPTSSIQNGDDGSRKVQVLREGVVRDVPVDLLGQEGDTHVFVSGRFTTADELILSSSLPLLDGERPVPAAESQATTTGGRPQPQPSNDF